MERFYILQGKRALDLALSVPLLLALSPVLLVIGLLIRRGSDGPVFFRQERVGKGGRIFTLYKFRTMVNESQSRGPSVTSRSDARITPLGRKLRKYKLDELPQIFNVIKGDMSLVGPRPEVSKYVEAFNEDYASILQINPGITDYAALRYRNEEEILAGYEDAEEAYTSVILPEKITLYKRYIKEMGLMADLKILFRTMMGVLKC